MSRMGRYNVQDIDGQALNQVAGRPMPSQGMDFAFNQPKAPFGPNPQFQGYQQPGQQGRDATPIQGRTPTGGGAPTRVTRDGVSFVSRSPANGGQTLPTGGNVWQNGQSAMLNDMGKIQAAGDRQFDRGNLVNNEMHQGIEGLAGRIEGAANREAGKMDEFASKLEDPNGAGQQDANLANKYAADAVSTQQRAEKEYQDTNAQTMASTSEAIQRSFQQQKNQIDNSDMTEEEKQSAHFQLQSQMRSQVASALAPLATRGQEMLAQLKNNLAQTQMGAGQTALGAGQQRNSTLQAAQHAREWSGNLRSSAPVTAASLEMQGRTALAGMIRDNPETVVSQFQSLMALYGADKAYGTKEYGFSGGQFKPQGMGASLGSRLW
mgnify:CR=1 FL=1